jgi:phospholipid/cholesterol/gamma-HCH transport system permease protein
MQVLISEPVLTATPSGDQLELRPGGAWVAANVARLEPLIEAVASELNRSGSLRVDMADVKELDTLGAWLLEKLFRGAVSRGHRAEIVGIADNYSGLMDELRQVNRHNPAPKRRK